jgi:hypothetical protein
MLSNLLLAAAVAAAAGLAPAPARAQLVPWKYFVYEYDPANGANTIVGEVFREDRDPGSYTEHWVLYPEYVYPNDANRVVVTLQPAESTYRDAADFFARVPWSHGSRYVKSTCQDGTTLPVVR